MKTLFLQRSALGAAFPIVLGLCAVWGLAGCGSAPPATAVSSYTPFVASDKSFAGEAPTGWTAESGDFGGTVGKSKFESGNAKITVVSDSASSFMGDAMRFGSRPAVELLHEKGMKALDDLFSDVSPLAMKEMTCPMGPARYSEFDAKSGSTEMHGYRVTVQGSERAIYLTCSCPLTDWPTLQPAFSHVISSLKIGS